MELISQLRKLDCQLQLDWVPREQNVPADDLTNSDFSKFQMARRLDIVPDQIPLLVLPELQKASSELVLQLQKDSLVLTVFNKILCHGLMSHTCSCFLEHHLIWIAKVS